MVRAYRTVRVAVPDIPLPEPGENSSKHLDQTSKRFQQHTAIEISKGNRLQASEKVWASIGYALSSVGELREWEHDSRFYKQLIARQVGNELAEAAADTRSMSNKERDEYFEGKLAEWMPPYDRALVMHNSFRQNELGLQSIKEAQVMAADFIRKLDEYKAKGYSDYTPRIREDQERLLRLNGHWEKYDKLSQPEKKRYRDNLFPTGVTKRSEFPQQQSPDNDDGSGGGVPNPDPKPDGGQDGGAIINGGGGLNLQRRENPDPPDKPAKPAASGGRAYPKRTEPKAPAQYKVAAGPAKERRRVIAPRPSARR